MTLSVAGGAAAQECTPDMAAAETHFSEAFSAIYRHQGYAWVCAPYIGDDLAKSSVVHVESLLEASGVSRNDAVIQADQINAKAKVEAAADTAIKSSDATREEVMIACSQMMDEQFQKFRVARAKMLKAQCDHR